MKAQLYSQNLQRFLSFKNQLRDSLASGNTTAQPTIAESEVQPASGVKPQAQPTVSPSAQQWCQTLSTPPEQTEEATTVSTPLGIPSPPCLIPQNAEFNHREKGGNQSGLATSRQALKIRDIMLVKGSKEKRVEDSKSLEKCLRNGHDILM